MKVYHMPVMAQECLSYLKMNEDARLLIDCNLGEGGHSELFLKNFPNLSVTGVDCDSQIMQTARERLSVFGDRVSFVNMWADEYLKTCNVTSADAVMFDFGISMFHYKASGRGFSFAEDEALDMRLDCSLRENAADIVAKYDEKRLADIIFRYGEEKKSRRIASAIVKARCIDKIDTTLKLRNIIEGCFSDFEKRKSRIDVCTRTFQALRIEVNHELDRIKDEILSAVNVLKKFGLILLISFHSLEDRIVKWTLRECAGNGLVEILTPRPVTAGESEIQLNPASRSAKLRVARRVL